MKFLQADINSIVEAQENGNLTVFIGAGFSKFSETETIKFPTWGEIIEELKNELNTRESDYLKVAQLYFLEFGEYKLYEKLKKFIPLHAIPSNFHEKLFRLLEPKCVITTNWDNLLEKTIINNGLIFDVVKNEFDLVKSNMPSKLIKIHGDFESHNIIFKEDDYLNYSVNNSLFDNFLKNILSTTTILFLGYSYSDNDLKQIIKWIEKHSKTSPPRFILSKGLTRGEKKYLENHGIKSLEFTEEEKNTEYDYLYESFFNSIEKTKNGVVEFEENETPDNIVVDFFYKKLHGLADLNIILPEQITHLFSNCTIDYHHNCFGLNFHDNSNNSILTTDYDNNIRGLYKQFLDILNCSNRSSNFKNKIEYITSRFLSAGVIFIGNGIDKIIDLRKFLNEDELDKFTPNHLFNFITFSPNMSRLNFDILTYSSKCENEKLELFKKSRLAVTDDLTHRRYLSCMISKFNHIAISRKLNRDMSFKEDHPNKKEFKNAQKYDFTNELISNNYPPSAKKYFQPLVDLLNFKYVYKLYYDSVQDNEKFLRLEESKKNGGFGFDGNEQRSDDRLIQLLRFCVGNDIILDSFEEFQSLMRSYIVGKIKIQNVKENFELSQYDLFILVKYMSFRELCDLINKYVLIFVKEDEGKGEEILSFNEESRIYLKTAFENLANLFIGHSDYFYSNTISESFINLILILSLVKWSDQELDLFLVKIKDIFIRVDIPLRFIEALNFFVIIQYKLYKSYSSKSLILIDAVLEGLISGKFRKPFYQRVNEDLTYVYQLSLISNIRYTNIRLIEKSLFCLDKDFGSALNVKRYFLQKFLLPVYSISSEEAKQIFIPYFDKSRISNWDDIEASSLYDEIFRELDFLQYGCNIRENFIIFLENWIVNEFDEEISMNINFIKAGGENLLLRYFDFLISEKNLDKFNYLKNILEEKIAKIKNGD